jgi:hypothetical protein
MNRPDVSSHPGVGCPATGLGDGADQESARRQGDSARHVAKASAAMGRAM